MNIADTLTALTTIALIAIIGGAYLKKRRADHISTLDAMEQRTRDLEHAHRTGYRAGLNKHATDLAHLREAAGPLVVVGNHREATGIFGPGWQGKALTIDQIVTHRALSIPIIGWSATNLAMQDNRYTLATAILNEHTVTHHIGDTT